MSHSRVDNSQIRKAILAARHAEQFKQFKENNETTLSLVHPHVWGGYSKEIYKKRSVNLFYKQIYGDERVDIITNENLVQDTTIVWHTHGASLKRALWGGGELNLEHMALTAKAIWAIGKYEGNSVLGRKINSRIVSQLNHPKKQMKNTLQACIEDLQVLERRLGQRVPKGAGPSVLRGILIEIEEYKHIQVLSPTQDKELEREIADIKNYKKWSFARRFNYERLKFLKACYKENIKAADELKARLEKQGSLSERIQTEGNAEIYLFIKKRLLSMARRTQALNQILTHMPGSKAYDRGDLNGYSESIVHTVREHRQDLHNPVTCEHQMIFAPDQKVLVDSDFHTDRSTASLERFMMMVSEVSGDNDALDQVKGKVKVTSATKWLNGPNQFPARNPYAISLFHDKDHFLGNMGNLLLFPFNLIETAFRGHKASWVATLWYSPPHDDLIVKDKANYFALTYRLYKKDSLSTNIGLEIYKAFNYLLVEGIWNGLADGWKMIKRLPTDIEIDFTPQDASVNEALTEMLQELKSINVNDELIQKEVVEYVQPFEDKVEETHSRVVYAQPSIPLEPYASHGLLNGLASGFVESTDLFALHMFAKNAFTGLVSSIGAGASFLAFYATPLATQILGVKCVNFLQGLGYIWTKSTVSASTASAFSNFKLVGALVEGIEHGPDSWACKAVSHLWKDPARTLVYSTLSYLIGYAIVNLVDVPYLTEELKRHVGDPPELSELFGGAKLGIIVYHILSAPHEQQEALRKEYINQCIENYETRQKTLGKKVSTETKDKIRACLEKIVSSAVIEKLRSGLKEAKADTNPANKKIDLMLHMALNKEKLLRLSPLLKAKLKNLLPQMAESKYDAAAVIKYLDPDKYTRKSTLRSFLGRTIGYIPTLFRCLLTPLIALATRSKSAVLRPLKDLGGLILDDITSTVHALSRLTCKVLEIVFNRAPRTFADILMNSVVARVASFFNYHEVTAFNYDVSAKWDMAQEELYGNTTGCLLNYLARMNTSPHRDQGLENMLSDNMKAAFAPAELPVAPVPGSTWRGHRRSITVPALRVTNSSTRPLSQPGTLTKSTSRR